jgi:ATP-dependent Clp protease ATP-binding subunit ClpB
MPAFTNFTTKAKEAIRRSHELALERGVNNVNSYHLLTALIVQDDTPIVSMLERMEIDLVQLTDELLDIIETGQAMGTTVSQNLQMYLTPDLGQVIERSANLAKSMNDQFVSVEHLFLAILEVPSEAKDLLTKYKVNHEVALKMLEEIKNDDGKPGSAKQFRVLSKIFSKPFKACSTGQA